MSFKTTDIIQFATAKISIPDQVAAIERRAKEASRDYGGADGEFAHSRLNFVLGRELAEQYRRDHSVPA
ncbi:MAG: hypothetical protein KBD06_04320 [Candidatus Pacebacteria bacterium]|nr:hypothetical protein [Candidatus Paceibacterota bacterium]